jgi:hypothetical protein
MSLLLSGPRFSHCDCHALGLEPALATASLIPAEAAEEELDTMAAAAAAAAAAALLPLAISLILSKGFLRPPALADSIAEAVKVGSPIWKRVRASGLRLPAAKRGCRKLQGPKAEAILSSPSFGILPPGLSIFLAAPDRSSGDSVSLGEDVGEPLAAADVDGLNTPAAARAAAVNSSMLSSCLRFRTCAKGLEYDSPPPPPPSSLSFLMASEAAVPVPPCCVSS